MTKRTKPPKSTKKKRTTTKYPGICYYLRPSKVKPGKQERIYYIYARVNGKLVEERVGGQWQDDMTPARASLVLADRRAGRLKSNKEIKAEEAARWTVDRLWAEYLKLNDHKKSIQDDGYRYNKYLAPTFGPMIPSEIDSLSVERFKKKLSKEGKSPQTIRNILELLRRLTNWGSKHATTEPLKFKISMPVANNLKTEFLTDEQIQRLLKACDESSNQLVASIVRLVLHTGMRRGEVLALQWNDVDFKAGTIHIREPKGGKDEAIPMSKGAREVLEAMPMTTSPYVFPGREGGQRKSVNNQLAQIKKAAGLPEDFRILHGLRHTYASLLASSGKVDMYMISRLLTHKDISLVKRYAHHREEALRQATDVASDAIQEALAPKPSQLKRAK